MNTPTFWVLSCSDEDARMNNHDQSLVAAMEGPDAKKAFQMRARFRYRPEQHKSAVAKFRHKTIRKFETPVINVHQVRIAHRR